MEAAPALDFAQRNLERVPIRDLRGYRLKTASGRERKIFHHPGLAAPVEVLALGSNHESAALLASHVSMPQSLGADSSAAPSARTGPVKLITRSSGSAQSRSWISARSGVPITGGLPIKSLA
jgi:hypothetical protein